MNAKASRTTLDFVGLGFTPASQAEGLRVIAADIIYAFGVAGDVLKSAAKSATCYACEDLYQGVDQKARSAIADITEDLFERILSHLGSGKRVSVCVGGSPICYSSIFRRLAAKARSQQLAVLFRPAESCVEAVCCAIEYDYASYGILIIDARKMLRLGLSPDKRIATAILGLPYLTMEHTWDSAIALIGRNLANGLGLQHSCYMISLKDEGSAVEIVSVRDLGERLRPEHDITLFIPPAGCEQL